MGEHRRLLLTFALGAALLAGGCRGCTGIDDFALEDGATGSSGEGGAASPSSGASPSGEGGGTGDGGDGASGQGGDAGSSTSSGEGGDDCTPCYDGPPATEDVGTCEGGVRCAGDEACEGQTLPLSFDDCATDAREDCVPGGGSACSGAPVGHGVITEDGQFVFGLSVPVAADDAGRTVGAAVYRDATYFDGSAMTAPGTSIVMWGLDATNTPAWRAQRVVPADVTLNARGIAMDGNDVVLLVQRIDDGVFALEVERWTWGSVLPASTRTFLNPLPLYNIVQPVARAEGRTFVVFGHDGSGDTDGDGQPDGEPDMVLRPFLAALDDAGQTVWSVAPTSPSDVAFHSLAVSGGELYLSGLTVGSIDLGCPELVPADSAFVAVFDTATGDCRRFAVVESLGGVAQLESSSSLVGAGPRGVATLFSSVAFDVRYFEPDLTPVWSQNVAATFYPGALDVDPFGHVLVAGGETIAKITTGLARKLHRDDGTPLWPADVVIGSDSYGYFTGGASLPDGGVMLGGSFYGSVLLEGVAYTASESASTFFYALAP
jgi:hypothetical protein